MELLEHQVTVLAGTGFQLALWLEVSQRTVFSTAINFTTGINKVLFKTIFNSFFFVVVFLTVYLSKTKILR